MKVNKFIGLVVAGIVAVSSLACGGEDNEDGEEDRIVVYNMPDGEYLYDKKFKFFGKWETAEKNKEKGYRIKRFVPDVISRTEGGSVVDYDYRYYDKECAERIPPGTYFFGGGEIILEEYLEKLRENDETEKYHSYVETYKQLDKYDYVNIDNKNRNIVKFPLSRDKKYCYLTWEEEEIDYYVFDSGGKCVKFENDMDMIYRGRSAYDYMLGVDSKDIECFSYDDLIERKETY